MPTKQLIKGYVWYLEVTARVTYVTNISNKRNGFLVWGAHVPIDDARPMHTLYIRWGA